MAAKATSFDPPEISYRNQVRSKSLERRRSAAADLAPPPVQRTYRDQHSPAPRGDLARSRTEMQNWWQRSTSQENLARWGSSGATALMNATASYGSNSGYRPRPQSWYGGPSTTGTTWSSNDGTGFEVYQTGHYSALLPYTSSARQNKRVQRRASSVGVSVLFYSTLFTLFALFALFALFTLFANFPCHHFKY